MHKLVLIAGTSLLLGLQSCLAESDVIERSRFFAAQQQYQRAYWMIDAALAEHPDDEGLWRVFWERRLDYLLDHGRELLFLEEEKKAITQFQMALAIDPDNRDARAWIRRANHKLAVQALLRAQRDRHEGHLENALKWFNTALSHEPTMKEAKQGIAAVNKRFSDRAEQSGVHYTLGSRARGEQKFQQSFYHSGVAKDLDESNHRAEKLRVLAGERLAEDLYDQAKRSQEKGYYAAALQDYLRVKAQVPDAPGLAERIAAMKLEVAVRELCRDAEMLARKKKFDDADAKLKEAFEMTKLEKGQVSGLMLQTKNLRYELAYERAKDFEFEFRFEAALAAFEDIDKAFPKRGFLDVKTRISSLKSHLQEAAKSYAAGQKAEKAGKLEEALDHYEEAVLVYPGYKNLDPKIKDLKSRIGN